MSRESKRLARVWLAMVVITLLAIPIGHATEMRPLGMGPMPALLAMAFIKSTLLLNDYLDLRHAPRWNAGLRAGLVLLLAIVAGLSLAARHS